MLTPTQIRELTAAAISNPPNKQVSQQFCDQLEKYLEGIAAKIDRLIFRVNDIQTTDIERRNFLLNFDYLTRFQFDKFIDLVWCTYEKALIQPGEACGAVAA